MTHPKKIIVSLSLASILCASALQGQSPVVIVNFDGGGTGLQARDVSFTLDYTGDGNATDGYSRFSFVDIGGETAWSQAGSATPLYGGAAAVRVNKSPGFDTYGYGGSLNLRAQSNAPVDGVAGDLTAEMNPFRLAAVFAANQEVDSSLLTSFSVNTNRLERLSGRFLLRGTDGAFYVSDAGTGTVGEAQIQAMQWAAVDVAAWVNDGSFAPVSLVFDFTTAQLGTLNGMGILAERDAAMGNRVWAELSSFEVTAIPEPRVYAALFGLFALGFVAWRRRRA